MCHPAGRRAFPQCPQPRRQWHPSERISNLHKPRPRPRASAGRKTPCLRKDHRPVCLAVTGLGIEWRPAAPGGFLAGIPMKKATRVAVGVVALCGACWMLPFYRVVSFLLGLPIFTSGLSIDDANDVLYGRSLLLSYATCMSSAVLLGFLYARRPRIMVIAPCLLVAATAVWVSTLRPEEIVVFFPSIRPFQPAQIGLLAGSIGIVFYMNPRPPADFDPS